MTAGRGGTDGEGARAGDRVLALARDVFGFGSLRPGQESVIRTLLEGRSALAVFPTGGGKSLCYQLPALVFDGLTLVISPLIALMKDQVDFLVGRGVAAAKLDSTLGAKEAGELLGRLRAGSVKILFVAPERFVQDRFRTLLSDLEIDLVAVDEAHCISEWGHNFRPDYLKVAQTTREVGARRVLALTATATPAVSADIREGFGIEERDHCQTSFRRANLHYALARCDRDARSDELLRRLSGPAATPAIVYVTLQHTAESVAGWLRAKGIGARPYHAGLTPDVRAEVQDAFMGGELAVVTATIAFGMGIDKADIRSVIHYNLPKSLENYAQESGRSGRDGGDALCTLLACADDLTVLENFVYGDTPSANALRGAVESLLGQGDTIEVSHYDLSHAHDIRPAVLATAIAYLEQDGYLAATGIAFRSFRVAFSRDEASLLAGYDGRQKAFLRAVFAAGKAGRNAVHIEPAAAAQATGEDEARIRRALSSLEEAGDVALTPSGRLHRYRRLRRPERVGTLVADMGERFARREAQDIGRLADVVRYAEARDCLTRTLVGYFGEDMPGRCGTCAVCLGEVVGGPVGSRGDGLSAIGESEVAAVHALVAERHAALRAPRQLARFLCGLTSPATSRARLGRHDAFGLLGKVPFKDVLAFVGTLNLG